jgi:uncharacterized protein YdcH (DUF465 family)
MQKSAISDPSTELDRLKNEHAKLEARLRELDRHLSLSPAEELERAAIKKHKLQLKDDMLHLSRA